MKKSLLILMMSVSLQAVDTPRGQITNSTAAHEEQYHVAIQTILGQARIRTIVFNKQHYPNQKSGIYVRATFIQHSHEKIYGSEKIMTDNDRKKLEIALLQGCLSSPTLLGASMEDTSLFGRSECARALNAGVYDIVCIHEAAVAPEYVVSEGISVRSAIKRTLDERPVSLQSLLQMCVDPT